MNIYVVITADDRVQGLCATAAADIGLVIAEEHLAAALRRLRSIRADAFVVDDARGDGLDAIAHLREQVPGTPIAVVARQLDPLAEAAYVHAGAAEILARPLDVQALRDALQRLAKTRPRLPAEPAPAAATAAAESQPLSQHHRALRWLSRVSLYAESVPKLCQHLVESVLDVFDAVRCAVLIEHHHVVDIAASIGLPRDIAARLHLRFDDGIMRAFDERAALLEAHDTHARPAVQKEMRLLGAQVAVPLLCNGRVIGALVLGEKASGEGYTAAERELLVLMARAGSLAFERLRAREAANRQHEHVVRAFENLGTGVLTVDGDRVVTLMNATAQELLRVDGPACVGRSVQKLGSALADVVLRAQENPGVGLGETITNPGTGARLQVVARAMGDGAVTVGLHQPSTTAESADGIAESPFWQYLAARVGQEIKNPMVAINTFAQLLPRKYDTAEFRESFSRVMQEEVSRINGVVETLYAFSRDSELRRHRYPLQQSIDEALAAFQAELNERGITLDIHFDPIISEADIDPIRFQEALRHVVQNAVDAMPNGGTLSVRTEQRSDLLAVAISDNGTGIKSDERDLIFQPFYSTKAQGMGLGLTLARRIATQHGGTLSLSENPESNGTLFEFELPLIEEEHADHSDG